MAIGIVVLLGLFFATDSFTSDERGWNGYKPFAISVGLFAIAAVWSLGGSKPPP